MTQDFLIKDSRLFGHRLSNWVVLRRKGEELYRRRQEVI